MENHTTIEHENSSLSLFFFFFSLPFPPPDTSPTKQESEFSSLLFLHFDFIAKKSQSPSNTLKTLILFRYQNSRKQRQTYFYLLKKKNTSVLSLNFLDSQRKGKTSRSSHNLLSWLVTTQLSGLKKKICFLKIISFLYSRK